MSAIVFFRDMGEELFKIEDIYDEHKIASRYRTRLFFEKMQ